MVLTHIKIALIYLVSASLWLAARSPRGIPAERTPRAVTPAQSRGIATTVNSLNVLRRRTQGRRRETRAGQLPAKRPLRRSTIAVLYATVNGDTETRHGYTYGGGRSFVKVDCETSTTVYEGGLDKRSSLDSLQQALFFSVLTGKRPAVVIYHTDGKEGRFEYRIRTACQGSL